MHNRMKKLRTSMNILPRCLAYYKPVRLHDWNHFSIFQPYPARGFRSWKRKNGCRLYWIY